MQRFLFPYSLIPNFPSPNLCKSIILLHSLFILQHLLFDNKHWSAFYYLIFSLKRLSFHYFKRGIILGISNALCKSVNFHKEIDIKIIVIIILSIILIILILLSIFMKNPSHSNCRFFSSPLLTWRFHIYLHYMITAAKEQAQSFKLQYYQQLITDKQQPNRRKFI